MLPSEVSTKKGLGVSPWRSEQNFPEPGTAPGGTRKEPWVSHKEQSPLLPRSPTRTRLPRHGRHARGPEGAWPVG